MITKNRTSYHKILDQILDNLDNEDTADGVVDIIVQQSMNYDKPEKFTRLVVQALCCPDNDGVSLDEMTKTLMVDTDGTEVKTEMSVDLNQGHLQERVDLEDDAFDNRDTRTTWIWIDSSRFIEVDPVQLVQDVIDQLPEEEQGRLQEPFKQFKVQLELV